MSRAPIVIAAKLAGAKSRGRSKQVGAMVPHTVTLSVFPAAETASHIAQTQKTMLQEDRTSCPTLGIQKAQLLLVSGVTIGINGIRHGNKRQYYDVQISDNYRGSQYHSASVSLSALNLSKSKVRSGWRGEGQVQEGSSRITP
jgi:hypothetical protein